MNNLLHFSILENWEKEVTYAQLKSSAMCIAVIDMKKEELLLSNKAFDRLTLHPSLSSFRNPDYKTLSNNKKSQPEPVFEGLMTIGHEADTYTTINARVFVKENQMLVTGEIDLIRLNKQHQRLIDLNSEINRLQRALTKEKVLLENTTKELEEANKRLTDLNNEKNQFLNMAAHDLRNPISTAISYIDILRNFPEQFTEEQRREFLGQSDERLRYSIDLMTELLDFSKIESGMIQLHLEDQDFIALVRKTLEFNQLLASKKNIRIIPQLPDKSIVFPFDQSKTEQVLNNLLSNAIKYSYEESEVVITVIRDKDHVSTSVQDHGVGIPENEISNLFEPYFKTSQKPTGGESSTGLGLAISKKIVEEHGGTISIESKMDSGSRFTFTYPLNK